jgi:putative NADH-flavin reductase
MKITILGITGATGSELSSQALARGHNVTGLVRQPDTLTSRHPKLRIVKGSVEQEEAMIEASQQSDVIVCTVGARGFRAAMKPTSLYSTAANNMVSAAKKNNIERLIAVTSGGTIEDPELAWWYRWIIKPLLQPTYDDMARMEAILRRNPTLRHILVRPGYLQNGAATNQYRTRPEKTPIGGNQTRRADLAGYILKRIEADDYQQEAVGITE